MWTTHVLVMAITFATMLLGAGILHLLPRLGPPGRAASEWCIRAPGLDLVVTYFTALPIIIGAIVDGWWGLAAVIVGQAAAVIVWCQLHELAHPAARRGPRIVKVLNRVVGPLRNHLALWVTAIVAPLFWLVRLVEVVAWPCFVFLVRFPRYPQGEWVNCSRQKFEGLVGHDLIWCLYCDWMTGIWSLGTEMLRNVESFWCPIRFHSEQKNRNARNEFPDLEHGWIAADGSMADVARTLEEKYVNSPRPHAWYGHPSRLTIGTEERKKD